MKRLLIVPLLFTAAALGGAIRVVQDQCGPFTDVDPAVCPFVTELLYLGITAGTSSTTFSPNDPLTRGQGAVFVAKGLNQSLARASRRAALGQWWTTQNEQALGLTALGGDLRLAVADGADIWSTKLQEGTVSRIRASDGRLLETWTGASSAFGVLSAMGRILVTSLEAPSSLYVIDPSQPAGSVTVAATGLPDDPHGLAFDGSRVWVAGSGAVSIVTPGPEVPWSVTTITTGFVNPFGMLYDGANIWVADGQGDVGTLLRLDANGAILQEVIVGGHPGVPVFDGINIWVPKLPEAVVVVNAPTGNIVATLTGNGLASPIAAAFDGQRIAVTNNQDGDSVSLWRRPT